MIKRHLSNTLVNAAGQFPIVTITGPRQSGKTTLIKAQFPDYDYLNFEELDIREWASSDPRNFLKQYRKYVIFDEVQRSPELFSYLQTVADSENLQGQFILSGSQSFLLNEKISQSLAGRVAVLNLLPFSFSELKNTEHGRNELNDYLFKGFYPRIYDQGIDTDLFYNSYLRTYVERDVRSIKNISNLSDFSRFLKLCAGRTGQLLNISSLATDAGISVNTAKTWISVLEQSFVVFLLKPFHKNFNKRLVKMPKLYFYDTGLLCSLLEIEKSNQLNTHYLRGSIFENFILNELLKTRLNKGKNPNLYFWRNNHGNEIDCIIEKPDKPVALEIKSGETLTKDFLTGLNYWKNLTGKKDEQSYLVYGGEISRQIDEVLLTSWKDMDNWIPVS